MTHKCPCDRCILLAMCKHKHIDQLMISCELVVDYTEFIMSTDEVSHNATEYYESDYYNFDKLIEVFKTLAPTKWSLNSMYSGR
jgi:hypothetical protein